MPEYEMLNSETLCTDLSVMFKTDEAKEKFYQMIENEPEKMCNILIGRSVEMLSDIVNQIKDENKNLENYEKLSDSDKSLAQKLIEAEERYAPQIESGELSFKEDNQNLLNVSSAAKDVKSNVKELIERGQDMVKIIEGLEKDLENIREPLHQKENNKDKTEVTR